ncbi:autotransporter domain-containing protein [Proteobacteria bacterium 005FR1]|nr:autotransporter domain-containing protein [Proteobacteria bacterium 005FR1]
MQGCKQIQILRRCLAAGLLASTPPLLANDESAERLFVFGDSLSDGGYYATLLPIPPSSSFTTNPDPVAPEVVAAELGLPLEVDYGLGGNNFATGDARVTELNNASVPIADQIDIALAGGARFGGDDLIYIQGGGNDFFAFADGGGADPTILTDAAQNLAEQVSRLQAAGARQIVTMSVPTGGSAGLALFNQSYEEALANSGVNVLYFDTDALFEEMIAFADEFGFTSIFEPACTGSALTCTRDDLVAPDANETHLLADSVHPAGKAQRIQGQAIASMLIAPEQIGQLAYAGQALFRNHRETSQRAFRRGFEQNIGGNAWYAKLGYHDFSHEGSAQITGVDEEAALLNIGLDHRLEEEASVGLSFVLSDGDGEFDSNRGDYKVDALSALFYARGTADRINLHADAMLGRARYEDLTRAIVLGPIVREHEGDTDTDFWGLGVSASMDFSAGEGYTISPVVGLQYQELEVDGYREDSTRSTAATFGDQSLDSLTGSLGATFIAELSDQWRLFITAEYRHEFNDDERELTITPSGAPISYTSELYLAERDYFSYGVELDYRLSDAAMVETGIKGNADRGDLERAAIYVGVRVEL